MKTSVSPETTRTDQREGTLMLFVVLYCILTLLIATKTDCKK